MGGDAFSPSKHPDLAHGQGGWHAGSQRRLQAATRFLRTGPRSTPSMNYAGERSSQQRLPTRNRGARKGRSKKDHCAAVANLGSSDNITAVNGLKGIWSSHVVAGAIVITTDFPSYVIKLTIMTDGKTSCLANFDYQLKDGNLLFDSGDGRFNSDVHAENVKLLHPSNRE